MHDYSLLEAKSILCVRWVNVAEPAVALRYTALLGRGTSAGTRLSRTPERSCTLTCPVPFHGNFSCGIPEQTAFLRRCPGVYASNLVFCRAKGFAWAANGLHHEVGKTMTYAPSKFPHSAADLSWSTQLLARADAAAPRHGARRKGTVKTHGM